LTTTLGLKEASQQIDEGIDTALQRAQTVQEIALRIVRDPIFERLVRKVFKNETAKFLTLVQQLTEEQHQRIAERASQIAKWCLGRLRPVDRLDVDTQAVREWRKQVGGQLRLKLIALIDEHWSAFQTWKKSTDTSPPTAEHWKARKGQPHEKLFAVDRMASDHTGLPIRKKVRPTPPDDLAPPRVVRQDSPPLTEVTSLTNEEEQNRTGDTASN